MKFPVFYLLYYFSAFILGCVIGYIYLPYKKLPKQSLPLEVSARFNFDNAEYEKRRFKDVQVTAYTNVPAQTDSTPNIMASGRMVYEGAIAVSQDFIKSKQISYGDLLCIKGNACYIVEDCLHERFKRQVDIFTFDAKKASNTKFKANIEVWRVVR